jgi:hypothetical protein
MSVGDRAKGKEMDEDRFNMDIRKFLKVVGVTSQREIETAVRDALAKGKLNQSAQLKPRVTLSIPELGLEHVVDGEIGLPTPAGLAGPAPSLFCGGHHDFDEQLWARQIGLDAGARRRVLGIDPGVPHRVHVGEQGHVLDPQIGREEV